MSDEKDEKVTDPVLVPGELLEYRPSPLFVEVQLQDSERQFIDVESISRVSVYKDGSTVQLDGWTVAIDETPRAFLARIGAAIIDLPTAEAAWDTPFDYFGVKMHPVASTNIKAIGFREDTLHVAFHSGDIYAYDVVGHDVFDAFMLAPSKGKFLNEIKQQVKAGKIRCMKIGTLS